jgi:hypothetical protein
MQGEKQFTVNMRLLHDGIGHLENSTLLLLLLLLTTVKYGLSEALFASADNSAANTFVDMEMQERTGVYCRYHVGQAVKLYVSDVCSSKCKTVP